VPCNGGGTEGVVRAAKFLLLRRTIIIIFTTSTIISFSNSNNRGQLADVFASRSLLLSALLVVSWHRTTQQVTILGDDLSMLDKVSKVCLCLCLFVL